MFKVKICFHLQARWPKQTKANPLRMNGRLYHVIFARIHMFCTLQYFYFSLTTKFNKWIRNNARNSILKTKYLPILSSGNDLMVGKMLEILVIDLT